MLYIRDDSQNLRPTSRLRRAQFCMALQDCNTPKISLPNNDSINSNHPLRHMSIIILPLDDLSKTNPFSINFKCRKMRSNVKWWNPKSRKFKSGEVMSSNNFERCTVKSSNVESSSILNPRTLEPSTSKPSTSKLSNLRPSEFQPSNLKSRDLKSNNFRFNDLKSSTLRRSSNLKPSNPQSQRSQSNTNDFTP